jgi:hypothetical protein
MSSPRATTAPVPRPPDGRAPAAGGTTVARHALTQAATLRARLEARTRLADVRQFGTTADDEAPDEPSPELLRLLAHLRSTVVTYVCARRSERVPIERVLPEVKCLVREAESCEGWLHPSELLLAQVVRWTIEAYYASLDHDSSLPFVPRFD